MAKTAVVNPRRKRRRRNPSTARASNPRRHYYGKRRKRRASSSAPRRRRRRNPGTASAGPITSTYSRGGYRRQNPGMFDIDHIMGILPAAVAGDFAARWALKLAGPMTQDASGAPVPGFAHAIAGVVASQMAPGMIASMLGDSSKAHIAEIASLAFTGSLFVRKRLLVGSEWVRENIYLNGVDYEGDDFDAQIDETYEEHMGSFENQSALGEQFVQDEDGNVYVLAGVAADPASLPTGTRGGMGSFENQSALGAVRPSSSSSFGYASR